MKKIDFILDGWSFIYLLFYHITLLDVDEILAHGQHHEVLVEPDREGRDLWYLGAITQCSP